MPRHGAAGQFLSGTLLADHPAAHKVRHHRNMNEKQGDPPTFGHHLARSVRGRPGAPPSVRQALRIRRFHMFQEHFHG
jgi:hypothetical protein